MTGLGGATVDLQCEVRNYVSRLKFLGFWPSCPPPVHGKKRKRIGTTMYTLWRVATVTASSQTAQGCLVASPALALVGQLCCVLLFMKYVSVWQPGGVCFVCVLLVTSRVPRGSLQGFVSSCGLHVL